MSATDYILIFDNLKIIHFDVVFSIFLLLINVCFRMFFELKHSCSSRIYLENILKLTAGDRFKFLLRTPRIYFQGGWGVAFILMGGGLLYTMVTVRVVNRCSVKSRPGVIFGPGECCM